MKKIGIVFLLMFLCSFIFSANVVAEELYINQIRIVKMVKQFKTSQFSNKKKWVEIVIDGITDYNEWDDDYIVSNKISESIKAMACELIELGWRQKGRGEALVTVKAGSIYVKQGIRGSVRNLRNVDVTYFQFEVCDDLYPCSRRINGRGEDVCNLNKLRDNLAELADDADYCVSKNPKLRLFDDNFYR
ncbi:hypothetical protein KAI92_04830 [Candidatus Parcubacteria bacterium]|nr:hypothetical protein [Candidatus Parcubacteria bacterium]